MGGSYKGEEKQIPLGLENRVCEAGGVYDISTPLKRGLHSSLVQNNRRHKVSKNC